MLGCYDVALSKCLRSFSDIYFLSQHFPRFTVFQTFGNVEHPCLPSVSNLRTCDMNMLLVVTVLLMCPDRPPEVYVCWAHGLLFVIGAMCSHVYCLSPPILLPNHFFSCSTCVSLVTFVCLPIYPPGVCSPVLIRCLTSCVYVECTQLSACLFFPFRVVFVHLHFISLLKRHIFLHLSPRLHLSSWFLTLV